MSDNLSSDSQYHSHINNYYTLVTIYIVCIYSVLQIIHHNAASSVTLRVYDAYCLLLTISDQYPIQRNQIKLQSGVVLYYIVTGKVCFKVYRAILFKASPNSRKGLLQIKRFNLK